MRITQDQILTLYDEVLKCPDNSMVELNILDSGMLIFKTEEQVRTIAIDKCGVIKDYPLNENHTYNGNACPICANSCILYKIKEAKEGKK